MRVSAPDDLKTASGAAYPQTQQRPHRCTLRQIGAMDLLGRTGVVCHCTVEEPQGSTGSAQKVSARLAQRHPGASICVVDEDPAVCAALGALFSTGRVHVVGFSRPQEFLEHRPADAEACAVVNLDSAGRGAVDLRHQIREKCACPIIYLSERGDIPNAVRAIREGAVDFLTKPVDDAALLSSIAVALDRHVAIRARDADIAALRRRFSTLSPRERQVLPLIIGGMRNKQAAVVLGISEVTVQVHRSQLMHETAARSFADLIRMSLLLGVAPTDTSVTSVPRAGGYQVIYPHDPVLVAVSAGLP